VLRLCPAAWKRPGEVSSAACFSMGAALDAAAAGCEGLEQTRNVAWNQQIERLEKNKPKWVKTFLVN